MSEIPAGLLLFGAIFLLLLFIAILVAIIVYVGKGQGKVEPSPRAVAAPAPEVPATLPPEVPEPGGEQPTRPGEVMRVIRDRETGRVLVEVGGQRYAHIREIRDAGIGRRVLWAIAELVQFTGGMATNPQAVRSAQASEANPEAGAARRAGAASPTPSTSGIGAPPASHAPQRLSDLRSLDLAEPSPPERSRGIIGFFQRGFQAPPPTEELPSPTAFIGEIDEILQRMVRELPAPPLQSVRVSSSESGALQILVGREIYSGADQIPDGQVRQLIQAAVAEWERR